MSMHDPVDLTNCDREPIHIPGTIQPHGCLLACDYGAAHVWRYSANAPAMLGIDGEPEGRRLDDLVGVDAAHRLRNALVTGGEGGRSALLLDLPFESGFVADAAIHRYRSTVIVEIEPAASTVMPFGAASPPPPLDLARTLTGRIRDIEDEGLLLRQSARLVRGALGYDRVMVYRFEQDGAGKVVSEARADGLESFLGQYFPASDIPRQARELYLRNTIRIIPDADGPRVPVIPAVDASGEPLDLSYAHLRSVSPIHCEYLRNMGVAASMSISVIVDGVLWGLIACHHYSPRTLSMAERVAAEMFGQFFSLHLHALQQKRMLETARSTRQSLDRFLRVASYHSDMDRLLRQNLGDFAALLPCNGVGLWMDGRWTGLGDTVPEAAIPELARCVASLADGRVWATHALSRRLGSAEDYAEQASGVLAVPLSATPRDYLFFFRKELVETLDWAGNPHKVYETGPHGDHLTPRKSFAVWKETVRRQSRPWSETDREIAEATRTALVEIVLRHAELMAQEREKADVRQRMLNDELNHRVKNILALIRSLVAHPVSPDRSLEDYASSLQGRIQALALAHDQVMRGRDGGLLRDLLEAELSPYRGPAATLDLSGPAVWLDARAFPVVALVLHELATNAVKYGALSVGGGLLEVAWHLTPQGDCELTWRESGGPPVAPPSRSGFGRSLIERSVSFDLGGESSVAYPPEGVRARFLLPAKHVSVSGDGTDAADGGGESGRPGDGPRTPWRDRDAPAADAVAPAAGEPEAADAAVLLVEDQMLIAMDVETVLAEHGFDRVTTLPTAEEALAKLATFQPDAAILDVNLGSGTSIPVAKELRRRGIPFVFATGYGDTVMIPPAFADVPVMRKPFDANALVAAITALLVDKRRLRQGPAE